MKRFFLLLLLLPLLASAYASPGKPAGFVNDFAKILKPETVSSLEATLTNFSQQTGNEISVVTIPIHGNDETIETYAEKLFQEWRVGKEKEDNGLLLLISRDDHEMRIEVGYGLEPIITDIESGRIIREVLTTAFKAGDFDGGVTQAVIRITSDITNGQAPIATGSNNLQFNDLFNPLVASLFFFIYFGSILARSKSWWAGGIIGGILGWLYFGGITIIFALVVVGLLFDYFVSRAYKNSNESGTALPWWIGGGGMGGGKGGGFGGFGGGMSGGGGASGRW